MSTATVPSLPSPLTPHAAGISALAPPTAGRRHPEWPVVALIAGYPLWWLLGLGAFVMPLLAVPMALELRRRRPVKLPRGFGVWLVFLVWNVISVVMLGRTAPHTVPGSAGGRLIGYAFRNLFFVAVTVILLFIGNLTELELSRRRLVRLLAGFFVVTVSGGLLGSFFPRFAITSPVELALPQRFRSNLYVESLVHPAAAQLQDVLGYVTARPKAPFDYTNSWGNNFAVLLTWFVVAVWVRRRASLRVLAVVIAGLGVIPVIYSLDRGLWIALALAAAFVGYRMITAGKAGTAVVIITIVTGASLVGANTPLRNVVQERLSHPHSNAIRGTLDQEAFDAAKASPVLGFGSTRNALGSPLSIAIGKSAACPQCGNAPVGSTGELWHDLIAVGFVGAGAYVWFFLSAMWRYRRDRSAIGIAGTTALGMALVFGLFYDAIPSALLCYFLSYALLWRNDMARRQGQARPTTRTGWPARPRPVEVPALR